MVAVWLWDVPKALQHSSWLELSSLCPLCPSWVGSPSQSLLSLELTAPAALFQDKHVEEVRKNKEGKDPGEAETD